jgi:hypothetical protein
MNPVEMFRFLKMVTELLLGMGILNVFLKIIMENGRQFLLTTKELMSNLNRRRGQKILSLI